MAAAAVASSKKSAAAMDQISSMCKRRFYCVDLFTMVCDGSVGEGYHGFRNS